MIANVRFIDTPAYV